jgi:hypothetical protein
MTKREIFVVQRTSPEGARSQTLVARGEDGSFWMEAEYLELTGAEMAALRRKEPSKVEREPRSGRVFVEVVALMQSMTAGERQMELYMLASEHLGIVAEAGGKAEG